MKIRSFKYYFREAFYGLIRNRLMTIASTITLVSCMFIVTAFICVALNIDHILSLLENTIGISVYIEDSVTPEQVNELFDEVSSIPNISNVRYMSSTEAMDEFKKSMGVEGNDAVFAGLTDANILPRTFIIDLSDSAHQAEVVEQLKTLKPKGISEIVHDQNIVDLLITVNNGIRIVCVSIILLLSILCVVLIMNTIKLAVASRRVEINIMKYVGATDWFIRWPFVFEGMLIGIIGSLIPIVICWISYDKVTGTVYENIKYIVQGLIEFKPGSEIFSVAVPVSITFGMLIGIIGSISSIHKHLRV